jgi:hypothetical protein
MALRLATASRNLAVDAVGDALNSGTIEIYVGSQPTNVSDAPSTSKLGTLTFSATAFGSPSNGVVTAAAITSDTNADASGTAGYARLMTSGAAVHSDATCGQGSGDFNFDNAVIVSGGTIAVSSLTLTQPI